MRSAPCNIVKKLWVGRYWCFSKLSPVINCVSIFTCDFKLSNKAINNVEVVTKITGIDVCGRGKIVADDSLVRKDHNEARSEALSPSFLRHEIGKVLWSSAAEDVELRRRDFDFEFGSPADLLVRSWVIEG